MNRIVLNILVIAFLVACPNPQTGKIDLYLTARTIINQANTALSLADGIFNQWLLGQTNAEKAKKAHQTYVKINVSVANGLQLALNGVDIAEQAKRDPDIKLLMAEANKAWNNLRKFMEDLLSKPEEVELAATSKSKQPTSQPITKDKEGLGIIKQALTMKKSPLDHLPKKLY